MTAATTMEPARQAAPPRLLHPWGTPVYMADHDPGLHNDTLLELILQAEKDDPNAALFGGINAVKSSDTLLTWQHPAIGWIRARIADAVRALMTAELGEQEARRLDTGARAEAWAVVYRAGGSLRPHIHHDSVWSGVYYVAAGDPASPDAGWLQFIDPRPGALAVGATGGYHRVQPQAGRMVAFPGWLSHSVLSTADSDKMRVAIAWNAAYPEDRSVAL